MYYTVNECLTEHRARQLFNQEATGKITTPVWDAIRRNTGCDTFVMLQCHEDLASAEESVKNLIARFPERQFVIMAPVSMTGIKRVVPPLQTLRFKTVRGRLKVVK